MIFIRYSYIPEIGCLTWIQYRERGTGGERRNGARFDSQNFSGKISRGRCDEDREKDAKVYREVEEGNPEKNKNNTEKVQV